MFDLIAQALTAWNQLGMLIGGGLMAGLGALLLGNSEATSTPCTPGVRS